MEQDNIAREATTMPLTPRVKAVVTLAESSLHELYNGAAVPACAWGLTREDGFSIIIPEAAAARLLQGLACLRARLRFEQGDYAGALDDVFAGMTLARHIGHGGTMVSVLVGFALESTRVRPCSRRTARNWMRPLCKACRRGSANCRRAVRWPWDF